MLTLRLPTEVDAQLTDLAAKTGQSKSFLAREAITLYLEDVEAALAALERHERGEKAIPLEELLHELAEEQEA